MVRAKFRVEKIVHCDVQSSTSCHIEVHARPVTGPGNELWSKYTPTGELRMTITNPAAAGELLVGSEYFVDFTPVGPTGPVGGPCCSTGPRGPEGPTGTPPAETGPTGPT